MKLFLLIVMALFPFLHSTSYKATLSSCQIDQIVVNSEQEKIEVSLFNVRMRDEEAGWVQTCSLLENAEEITFEIDPSSKLDEPLPVWLFADGQLIQEELILQDNAFTMIHNPEYTYQDRLEQASTATQTIANLEEQDTVKRRPVQGPLYVGIAFIIWSGMIYIMLRKRRKKQKVHN